MNELNENKKKTNKREEMTQSVDKMISHTLIKKKINLKFLLLSMT